MVTVYRIVRCQQGMQDVEAYRGKKKDVIKKLSRLVLKENPNYFFVQHGTASDYKSTPIRWSAKIRAEIVLQFGS